MKKLLTLTLSLATIAAVPVAAEIDPKIHKLCIEAKDYSGCIKAQGVIKGSDTASSGVAEARSKEMSDKLYDFNRRQFIVQNPSLADWVKSNPKLARESIEKELLFFRDTDYNDSNGLYSVCKRRGETIDYKFNWSNPCSGVSNKKTVSENNKWLYMSFNQELERQVADSVAKEKCTRQGKQLRYGYHGESMCMSDFEYASYEEQQRARRAEEAYRARIIRQGQIDRKNAANRRMWESINNSMKSLGETINPKRINCTTTYGSYTSNTSCY